MHALSLSELTAAIGEALESALPEMLWIVAEIAEARCNARGHCYLELVERQDDRPVAQMRATLWSSAYRILAGQFEEATGRRLEKGMQILFAAELNFHAVYGLSLNIREIDPTYSLGEMARKKREVIERLLKEALLDRNARLALPLVPQRIAVISSPSAAGYGDFVNHIERNPYGYRVFHDLYPSTMQGAEASSSLLASLKAIRRKAGSYDAVAIIRGGGSQADLSCFDGYDPAAQVALFPLPVITGIGHERDDTVLDMAAHTKCKTPTDVAQFILSAMRDFEEQVIDARSRLVQLASEALQAEQHRVGLAAHRLSASAAELTHHAHRALQTVLHRLLRSADTGIHGASTRLGRGSASLKVWAERAMEAGEKRVSDLEQAVRLLDPVNVLRRGYSITRSRGGIVRDRSDVIPGDRLYTQLASGAITSRVEGDDEER